MTNHRPTLFPMSRRRALGSVAAALAPVALTGIAPAVTRAQESTPMSTPAREAPSAREFVERLAE